MNWVFKYRNPCAAIVLLAFLLGGCTRVPVPTGASSSLAAASGPYLVYKVNGHIALPSGAALKKGDRLSEADQLQFADEAATALVCHLGTGQRYVLQPPSREAQGQTSEKTGLLRDNLVPDTGPRRISSRAVTVHYQPLTLVNDLTGGASPDSTVAVLFFHADTLDVRFVQPGDAFYVAFEWQQQLIPKKLVQADGGQYVLNIPTLLSVDYLPVQLETTSHWRLVWQPAGKQATKLASFMPVWADSSGALAELDLLVPALQAAGKPSTFILNEAWAFLAAHHARPVASQFEAYLRTRYGLKPPPVVGN